MLYNLYYIYQIDKLGICLGPIQETIITIQSNQWKQYYIFLIKNILSIFSMVFTNTFKWKT
jgi:hypothetical protein